MTRCYLLAERPFKANLNLAGSLWAAQHVATARGLRVPTAGAESAARVRGTVTEGTIRDLCFAK